MGEERIFGDLTNVPTALTPFIYDQYNGAKKIKLLKRPATIPGIRSFFGILRLIAEKNDPLYTPKTRLFVKELLQRHGKAGDILDSFPPTPDQLESVKKLRDEWERYAYQRMAEK